MEFTFKAKHKVFLKLTILLFAFVLVVFFLLRHDQIRNFFRFHRPKVAENNLDKKIKAFYDKHKNELASPLKLRVSEIVVPSENMAKKALIALLQGEDFAKVARERSMAASAPNGGDLGFIEPEDKFPKFYEIAASLDEGQISQIFQGADGYYVIRVDVRRGGKIPALADVYEQVKAAFRMYERSEGKKAETIF